MWRVPKLTSFSTVRFIRAPLTVAAISRQPRVGVGGGAAAAKRATGREAGNSLRIARLLLIRFRNWHLQRAAGLGEPQSQNS